MHEKVGSGDGRCGIYVWRRLVLTPDLPGMLVGGAGRWGSAWRVPRLHAWNVR